MDTIDIGYIASRLEATLMEVAEGDQHQGIGATYAGAACLNPQIEQGWIMSFKNTLALAAAFRCSSLLSAAAKGSLPSPSCVMSRV